ncbi:MAG TPA: hypothetical protein VGB77_03460 [Abditibacteriaceae bacterium]
MENQDETSKTSDSTPDLEAEKKAQWLQQRKQWRSQPHIRAKMAQIAKWRQEQNDKSEARRKRIGRIVQKGGLQNDHETMKDLWIEEQERRETEAEISDLSFECGQLEFEQELLKQKYEPKYPLPDPSGQWTPKIVQEYLGVKYGVVQHAVSVLAKRKPTETAALIHINKSGELQTWNEKQMKRVVDYVRTESSAYKKRGRTFLAYMFPWNKSQRRKQS